MKFLQTKPQVKNVKIKYYHLYFTAMKNRDNKEIVNYDEYENDYIIFKDFINPNHFHGGKNDNVMLR